MYLICVLMQVLLEQYFVYSILTGRLVGCIRNILHALALYITSLLLTLFDTPFQPIDD